MPTLTLTGMHTRSELFGDTVNRWDRQVSPGGSSGSDAAAVIVRRGWARRAADMPLLLGPASTRASFLPGQESRSAEEKRRYGRSMALTVWSTVVGAPAVAVPTSLVEGRPVGVQLIGPAFREDVVLDAAQAIERERGVLAPIEPR